MRNNRESQREKCGGRTPQHNKYFLLVRANHVAGDVTHEYDFTFTEKV